MRPCLSKTTGRASSLQMKEGFWLLAIPLLSLVPFFCFPPFPFRFGVWAFPVCLGFGFRDPSSQLTGREIGIQLTSLFVRVHLPKNSCLVMPPPHRPV